MTETPHRPRLLVIAGGRATAHRREAGLRFDNVRGPRELDADLRAVMGLPPRAADRDPPTDGGAAA